MYIYIYIFATYYCSASSNGGVEGRTAAIDEAANLDLPARWPRQWTVLLLNSA
jgi:hypothetical protein